MSIALFALVSRFPETLAPPISTWCATIGIGQLTVVFDVDMHDVPDTWKRGHACVKTGHVMLMADVIVDTKLTCMYVSNVSIDAVVDIRLAKLVMCLVFFTWTRMCTRNLKTVIHIGVDRGWCLLTCMYISIEDIHRRLTHGLQCLHTCTYP